jgi:DNA-binding NtrC family response regulator
MLKPCRILVVDDDPLVRHSIQRILSDRYELMVAENGQAGLDLLQRGGVDLALVDLKLPDIGGMDILRQAPDLFPAIPIVIITGYSTVREAVETIKLGAFDYLSKPFTPEELENIVDRAFQRRTRLRNFGEITRGHIDEHEGIRLIGQSAAMRNAFSHVQQVARTASTVLLVGESGTGKEVFARMIHAYSPRAKKPFLAIDCGAIAPQLIGSELFGHVRGAFTGAASNRVGLFQSANGGTFFMDEIANLPLDQQAIMLRLLETKEVRPVGASNSEKIDVRLIAATNQNLATMVKEGKFRQDLYYRLSVFPINLPPLRERREDIAPLAEYFLRKFNERMRKNISGFSPEALESLANYDWPGNVRELSNVVERMVILCDHGVAGCQGIEKNALRVDVGQDIPQNLIELNAIKRRLREQVVAEIERAFLLEALERNSFNASQAAADVGMRRSNFQALLRKYNLRIRDLVGKAVHP